METGTICYRPMVTRPIARNVHFLCARPLTPFFTSQERRQASCQHRLFFSQVELCDNLIFFRRAAVDQFAERLLDRNRTIGQPKKITLIFGRKVTRHTPVAGSIENV